MIDSFCNPEVITNMLYFVKYKLRYILYELQTASVINVCEKVCEWYVLYSYTLLTHIKHIKVVIWCFISDTPFHSTRSLCTCFLPTESLYVYSSSPASASPIRSIADCLANSAAAFFFNSAALVFSTSKMRELLLYNDSALRVM